VNTAPIVAYATLGLFIGKWLRKLNHRGQYNDTREQLVEMLDNTSSPYANLHKDTGLDSLAKMNTGSFILK